MLVVVVSSRMPPSTGCKEPLSNLTMKIMLQSPDFNPREIMDHSVRLLSPPPALKHQTMKVEQYPTRVQRPNELMPGAPNVFLQNMVAQYKV